MLTSLTRSLAFVFHVFPLKWPVSIYITENTTKLYLLGLCVALPQRSLFHGRLLCVRNSAAKNTISSHVGVPTLRTF